MSHSVPARTAGSRAKLAFLMAAGALGCAMAAGAANAADTSNGAPTLVVRYSTQALTTNSGVQDLYRRIRLAAKQVCPESSVHDLRANEQAEVCRQQAVSKAIQQINNSQLAALHATSSKSG